MLYQEVALPNVASQTALSFTPCILFLIFRSIHGAAAPSYCVLNFTEANCDVSPFRKMSLSLRKGEVESETGYKESTFKPTSIGLAT